MQEKYAKNNHCVRIINSLPSTNSVGVPFLPICQLFFSSFVVFKHYIFWYCLVVLIKSHLKGPCISTLPNSHPPSFHQSQTLKIYCASLSALLSMCKLTARTANQTLHITKPYHYTLHIKHHIS